MARTSLEAALPQVFVDAGEAGSPLAALIAAGDGMLHPVADTLDHLEVSVNPFLAGDALVCYLAAWVDLDWLTIAEDAHHARSTLPGGVDPLRDLIAASADLSARRGTASGMVRFLELATRVGGFGVSHAGGFHLVVELPADAEPHREVVARIVAAIKPAHVTAELSPPPGADPHDPADPASEEPR
jgi:hypothetical protein